MKPKEPARPFVERVFEDFVAAMSLPMVVLGDRLGLYRAMAGAGPLTPSALARRTGTAERYVREWLSQQAAGGYVVYDEKADRFYLPDEHVAVLADELSPSFLAGAFQLAFGYAHSARHVLDAFRTGEGVVYDHQDPDVYMGVERFYLPAYTANLMILHDAQQLYLQSLSELADLVEKQRAAVGRFEQAGLRPDRPCERALLVAKHFRFEQRVRQGSAIHRDKRLVASRAVPMDGACD